MRIPFSFRIIASVVIIELIMLSVLVWSNIRIINESYFELLESSSYDQSVFLSSAIAPGLVAYDYALIEDALSSIEEKDNIVYAEVYDVFGKKVGAVGEYTGSIQFLSANIYQLVREDDILHVARTVKVGEQDVGSLRIGFSLITLHELLEEIKWQNLFISFITLSVLVLATVIISLVLTNKLRNINNGVIQIQEGNLDYKINVKENDELGDLAHAFNEMTQKINNEHSQLEEREQHLSLTLDSIADAVITTDVNGDITRMNPIATELTGWKNIDAKGHSLAEVFKISDPKNSEVSESPDEKEKSINEIVKRSNHTTLINKDGTEYQIAHSAAPIIDTAGKILGTILVFRDITQQNQTEEALRRSQKMDAIGQLSGGIAHDFNNQLNIIVGYLDFLTAHFNEKDKPYKWVQTATKATLRCMDLTRQLLSFSRRQVSETVSVDLNSTFDDLQTMISRSVTPEIDVQYFLQEDIWLTETNIGEFQDVIINLVINSRDAMPHGGKIVIETKNKIFDDNSFDTGFEIKGGEYVEIVISDIGLGMEKETLDHIFEPFFTTKPKGKGTGLGMAMVYGFVKRYGGYIKVYSEPGEGTSFHLYLPRSNKTQDVSINENKDIELLTGNESVLIVDDEIDLLELSEKFLSELGYKTKIAENGTQAIDILRLDNNIDLLFSDVVMPGGFNGYELAQIASQLNPEIKVLLTSGFTSKTLVGKDQEKFSKYLLNKPYRKYELAKRVRQVLDEVKDN